MGSGALTRPHCHSSNAELFIDVCLKAPAAESAPVFTAVGEEQRPWGAGEVRVLDGSFEHVMANRAPGESAVSLRLAVRHPHLPCVGTFEVCGIRGLIGNLRRTLSRMIFGSSPFDISGTDGLSDEL